MNNQWLHDFKAIISLAVEDAFSKMTPEQIREMCFDYASFGKSIPPEDIID